MVNWTTEPQPFGPNHAPLLEGLSSIDGRTPVPVAVNPANGSLLASVVSGGGDTQYQEGATTSPAIGTVALGRYIAFPPGTLADGALSAPLMDNYGQLKVVVVGTAMVGVATITGTANFATGQVALASTATQIVASRSTRRSITIVNLSTTDMYIGGSGVTTGTGQLLLGVKGTAITLEVVGAVYGIVASGTPSVSFEEEYS